MDLEIENKFNEYGWKSRIICDGYPELVNIIVPDIKSDNNLIVIISNDIEHTLTTNCRIILQEDLYYIKTITINDENDYLCEIYQKI